MMYFEEGGALRLAVELYMLNLKQNFPLICIKTRTVTGSLLGFQGPPEASADNPTIGGAANMERAAKVKELELKMNKRMLVHRLAK